MMYGEVRGGISEHTLVCGNTTSSSSEQSEYDGLVLPGSDSLPVPVV